MKKLKSTSKWEVLKKYLLAVHEEYLERNGLDYCKNCGISMEELVKEIEEILSHQREEIKKWAEGQKKSYPKNIKHEIWDGENGLPNTIIESPDAFGIKYVEGFNEALNLIINHLANPEKEQP